MKQLAIVCIFILILAGYQQSCSAKETKPETSESKISRWDILFPESSVASEKSSKKSKHVVAKLDKKKNPGSRPMMLAQAEDNEDKSGARRRERESDEDRQARHQRQEKRLLKFLDTYVPELYGKMIQAKKDDPERYPYHIRRLYMLFRKVMEQMEEDPEKGKLSLERVLIVLKIKDELRKADEEDVEVNRDIIHNHVNELFDVIIMRERLRLDRLKESVKEIKTELENNDDMDKDKRRRAERRLRHRPRRIEKYERNLKSWIANKDKHVNDHVNNLIEDIAPFPWGR